ncbi:hypothetical protein CEB3_c14180 [Peptococcaceae bacterium CEB3]|nr:hypothetical protein CEB3_c14180 [Peptococcaceae bacterium CEB3]
MTKVKVFAGACGFTSVIKAQSWGPTTVKVGIVSACKMLRGMNEDLGLMDWTKGIFNKVTESVIYRSAGEHLKHTDCPVPCAIIKAIQVEIGAAVPKNVEIKIEKFNNDPDNVE